MIVARVALKKALAINGWPHTGDKTAPIGTGNRNKGRHTIQAEDAPVVAERAGKGHIIIQIDMAAVLAAQAVDGQSGRSIHHSPLMQQRE